MRREHRDLALPAVLTVAAVAVLLLVYLIPAPGPATTALRVLAGVPLVLVLPGYAVSTLLLPGGLTRPQHIHPLLWRGMWSVGLSLVIAVLGGLVLNLTPTGLTSINWTMALSAITLLALAATAAARRRAVLRQRLARTLPLTVISAGQAPEPAASRRGAHALAAGGYALAAAALAGGAIWLAVSSAAGQPEPGFAQLWLVPARRASAASATLGLRNDYHRTERFRLVLQRGTRTAAAWNLTLAAGRDWRTVIADPPGGYLRATLTMPGQHVPARTVTVGVPPSRPARTSAYSTRRGRTHAGLPGPHATDGK